MTPGYYTWGFVPIPVGLLVLVLVVICIIERRNKR